MECQSQIALSDSKSAHTVGAKGRIFPEAPTTSLQGPEEHINSGVLVNSCFRQQEKSYINISVLSTKRQNGNFAWFLQPEDFLQAYCTQSSAFEVRVHIEDCIEDTLLYTQTQTCYRIGGKAVCDFFRQDILLVCLCYVPQCWKGLPHWRECQRLS